MLSESKLGFGNSLKNEKVVADVAEYGFSKERLEYCLDLNKRAGELCRAKGKKAGRKRSLTITLSNAIEKRFSVFIQYRKILRKAFKFRQDLIVQLGLDQKSPRSYAAQLLKMKEFYELIQEKEELFGEVNVYGLSKDRIAKEYQALTAIDGEIMEKARARMEDEKATDDRKKILKELVHLWGTYREVLKTLYLDEDPQSLEAFGIHVPSTGFYSRKKQKKDKPREDSKQPLMKPVRQILNPTLMMEN